MESIFDVIYPTGSIYMSMSNVSPEILFGGKWAPLNGLFLLATDVDQQAGERGGEQEHVLTYAELPTHSHQCGVEGKTVGLVVTSEDEVIAPGTASVVQLNLDNEYYRTASRNSAEKNNVVTTEALVSDKNNSTRYAPQNQPHNNMPPYITVYMWHRVG